MFHFVLTKSVCSIGRIFTLGGVQKHFLTLVISHVDFREGTILLGFQKSTYLYQKTLSTNYANWYLVFFAITSWELPPQAPGANLEWLSVVFIHFRLPLPPCGLRAWAACGQKY